MRIPGRTLSFPPHYDKKFCTAYLRRALSDFWQIVELLPNRVDRLLDIGCGPGGIAALIGEQKNTKIIHLVDGDGTVDKRLGFTHDCKAWNNVEDNIVKLNYPGAEVICHPPDPRRLKVNVDLIVSFMSWGHHYPVAEYLTVALNNPKAPIILDIRRGSKGEQVLTAAGYNLFTVEEQNKFTRYMASK